MRHIGNYNITVGLLGGSFNPAHAGHRYISEEAIKRLGLDQLWWLVAPQNPLKPVKGMLSLDERVRRAQKFGGHPKIFISSIEKQLHTCYTADTLRQLRLRFPHVHFVWIMGLDNLIQFPLWHQWHNITQTVPILVIDRGNTTLRALSGKFAVYNRKNRLCGEKIRSIAYKKPPCWAFLALRKHNASSTQIRKYWENTQK